MHLCLNQPLHTLDCDLAAANFRGRTLTSLGPPGMDAGSAQKLAFANFELFF